MLDENTYNNKCATIVPRPLFLDQLAFCQEWVGLVLLTHWLSIKNANHESWRVFISCLLPRQCYIDVYTQEHTNRQIILLHHTPFIQNPFPRNETDVSVA